MSHEANPALLVPGYGDMSFPPRREEDGRRSVDVCALGEALVQGPARRLCAGRRRERKNPFKGWSFPDEVQHLKEQILLLHNAEIPFQIAFQLLMVESEV